MPSEHRPVEGLPFAYGAFAFGYRWRSDLPLTAFEATASAGIDQAGTGLTAASSAAPDSTVQGSTTQGSTTQGTTISVRVHRETPPEVQVLETIRKVQRTAAGMRYVSSEMVADVIGDQIHVFLPPRAAWRLPPVFFGTVIALLLARLGGIPIHGSAVAMDGRAVLLCGTKGAGKSSLTAALLASGARFISDDLSVLRQSVGAGLALSAGRRAIRLFPDVAAMLGRCVALEGAPVRIDRKLAVVPPRVESEAVLPLMAVVVLGSTHSSNRDAAVADEPAAADLLLGQTYRPEIMKRMPGYILRKAQLQAAARNLPVLRHPTVETRDADSFRDAATELLRHLSQV